jgi:hypothetical protein
MTRFYSCHVPSQPASPSQGEGEEVVPETVSEESRLNTAISWLCKALELMKRTDITLDDLTWEIGSGTEIIFYLKDDNKKELAT